MQATGNPPSGRVNEGSSLGTRWHDAPVMIRKLFHSWLPALEALMAEAVEQDAKMQAKAEVTPVWRRKYEVLGRLRISARFADIISCRRALRHKAVRNASRHCFWNTVYSKSTSVVVSFTSNTPLKLREEVVAIGNAGRHYAYEIEYFVQGLH